MKTNLNNFALAILFGGIGMSVVAGLWRNLIMPNLYTDVEATHESIGLLFVAYFILAGFMAYLYPLINDGKKPVADGLKFGVIIGLLWVFPHGLAMAGAHGTSIIYEIKNSAWHMVEQGIGGIIIALTYGKD